MTGFAELGLKEIFAVLFITVGTVILVYDLRGIIGVLRSGNVKNISYIVKGIRILTTLTGIALLAAGVVYESDTVFLLGLVIGIEELYETTLVLTALKYSKADT